MQHIFLTNARFTHLFPAQGTGHLCLTSVNQYNRADFKQAQAWNDAVKGGMGMASPPQPSVPRAAHMVQPSIPQFVGASGFARPAPVEFDRMAYAASTSPPTPTTNYKDFCDAVSVSEADHMGIVLASYAEQRSRSNFRKWADWRAGVSDAKGKRKAGLQD